MRIVFLLVVLVFATSVQGQLSAATCARADISQEGTLVNRLLANYDKRIKPTANANTKVTVHVQIVLNKVEDLDSESELLSTNGYLIMYWRDEFLHWNPADYCGVTQVFVSSDDVWLPEISVKNSVQNGNDLSMYTIQKYRISVSHMGMVRWVPLMTWVTMCKMNVYYFPFDQQVCQVNFTNWMYSAALLNFSLISDSLQLDGFHNHSEWLLIDSSVGELEYEFNMQGRLYPLPIVWFSLTLQRAPSYYVVSVLFVSGVLTAVCLLMFALPVHAVDKVILGVTLLLSYAVLLITVNDATPQSETVPLVMIVICMEIMLCASSIICSTIVLRVHDHPPLKPIPIWAKNILLRRVASCLKITVVVDEAELDSHVVLANGRSPDNHVTNFSHSTGHLQQRRSAKVVPVNEPIEKESELEQNVIYNNAISKSVEDEVKEYFRLKKKQFCEEEKRRLYEGEWRDLARVLDALFLITWGFIFLLMHTLMYLYLYGYIQHRPHVVENSFE